ncbi:uncharacterized protein B0T23DRAFT_402983 [Neurospora hispaniola]|uniref:Uncharacterized protein n=1 Tax=Neurospora hispaniola TaxID=588809 RepID=A0AAJ0IDW6_9PEZI|nr:hypothetical protein B0T23DRAFT_402983 [Neurospora hispaniola]
MDLSPVASLVDTKVDMPASSAEVITMPRDEESSTITSPAKNRSYCHALSVVEVTELAKRLDLTGSVGQDTAKTAENSTVFRMDGKHAMTTTEVDDNSSAQDGRTSMSDGEASGNKQNGVACALRSDFATKTSTSTATSIQTTDSLTKTASDSQKAVVEDTVPVPTIYPPRRPNIFNKSGMKRAARPVYVWSQASGVQDFAKAAETIDDDDGEGFTAEDLKEFQSAGAEKMERKTQRFLHMVNQYSWRPRRLEDLGEAFAIED